MLNIIFNRGAKDIEDANYVFSPDTYFKYNYEDEWFDDELVKKMVQTGLFSDKAPENI